MKRFLLIPPSHFYLLKWGEELKRMGYKVKIAPPPPNLKSPCGLALSLMGENLPELSFPNGRWFIQKDSGEFLEIEQKDRREDPP